MMQLNQDYSEGAFLNY